MEQAIVKISTSPGVVRRREVLLAAAMAPALAFPYSQSKADASGPAGVVFGAVFDSRFPQSLAFAERARALGIRPFGFTGEMSSLWFDQLLPALQTSPTPLVGLTSTGALFCFEQMAWDAGMRVRFRIDHREGDRGFGAGIADVALSCTAAWGDCTHAVVPPRDVLGSQALVTWVIAPLNS